MARLYLLVPIAVVVVGLASMWHALVTLEGVASLTDTPTVIGRDQPLPTTMRYVRIEGAALDESSVLEVRVSHTERSGREILDHTYFASTWQRPGQRFQVHTNAAPRADVQLLGVYHPAESVLVSGPSGATMAGFARNVWIWSAVLVVLGALALGLGLRGEREVHQISRTAAPAIAGFRSSARPDEVRELRRGTSTRRAVLLLSGAAATFGISLVTAYAQFDLDPHLGASEIFQITPLFVVPVLLYMAVHDRVTITVRRGSIEKRGVLGWPSRLVVEPGDACVIRRLVHGRGAESPDAPYSVEIPKDGARFRIARVAGETSARELAAQVNRLLEDANRD